MYGWYDLHWHESIVLSVIGSMDGWMAIAVAVDIEVNKQRFWQISLSTWGRACACFILLLQINQTISFQSLATPSPPSLNISCITSFLRRFFSSLFPPQHHHPIPPSLYPPSKRTIQPRPHAIPAPPSLHEVTSASITSDTTTILSPSTALQRDSFLFLPSYFPSYLHRRLTYIPNQNISTPEKLWGVHHSVKLHIDLINYFLCSRPLCLLLFLKGSFINKKYKE